MTELAELQEAADKMTDEDLAKAMASAHFLYKQSTRLADFERAESSKLECDVYMDALLKRMKLARTNRLGPAPAIEALADLMSASEQLISLLGATAKIYDALPDDIKKDIARFQVERALKH